MRNCESTRWLLITLLVVVLCYGSSRAFEYPCVRMKNITYGNSTIKIHATDEIHLNSVRVTGLHWRSVPSVVRTTGSTIDILDCDFRSHGFVPFEVDAVGASSTCDFTGTSFNGPFSVSTDCDTVIGR